MKTQLKFKSAEQNKTKTSDTANKETVMKEETKTQ